MVRHFIEFTWITFLRRFKERDVEGGSKRRNPASQTSVILDPGYHFLPQYRIPYQNLGESRFPRRDQIPYTNIFPNPALYFVQMPDPENSLPVRERRTLVRT